MKKIISFITLMMCLLVGYGQSFDTVPKEKTAILMVPFGTTSDDTRALTIDAINEKARGAFMGTLIPMGPGHVGPASGDIVSIACNMQVAFATTVVGMAVAAIGLATLQSNRRFYAPVSTILTLYPKKFLILLSKTHETLVFGDIKILIL